MDRRYFVAASGLAAAAVAAAPRAVFAQPAGTGDAQLTTLFDAMMRDTFDNRPEFASYAGADKTGDRKRRLDPRTAAFRAGRAATETQQLRALQAIDPATLSPAARLNREIVIYQTETRLVGPTRFGLERPGEPYVLSQLTGAYFDLPDFLNTTHTIADASDAEAYLARLAAFATALDQDTAEQRAQAARGFVAPAWSLELALGQLATLRAKPAAENTLVRSLVTRATAKGLAGNWSERATAIVAAQVYPALDRQLALVRELRGRTPAGDGAWRLPQGDALYAAALEAATTTKYSPDEVHRLGLEQVAKLSAELDRFLSSQGLTQGGVGARLAQFNVRPDQLYGNDEAGRKALLAQLNRDIQAEYARLPQVFATLPRAPLEIRAVPADIQDGAPNGYYRGAALDGSRPAIYFINLKDTRDWPKYSLPTLSYHEGVPGHHLQIAIAQESKDIPLIRKFGFFSAYSEGWALYAESLADETGAYAGDPVSRAGMLQSFLFRAARLVVDTGIHTKRWSREQATDYMVQTTGFARPRSQREVERYCIWPGQACSYFVGRIAWVRARAAAQAALGARFDLKRFHEVLKDGSMPLTVLERRIAERTAAARA